MTATRSSDVLILALDMPEREHALDVIDTFSDYVHMYKVGLELFTSCGPSIIQDIQKRNKKVFLDLKFHDITTTVSKAALVAARLGVHMFTIHTSNGFDTMKRCRESVVELCLKENRERPKILGVTVLTNMTPEILKNEMGIQHGLHTHVRHLSALALKAGLDGVVASGREAEIVRNHCGRGFLIVSPGIRPSWSPPDDQKRTMTPREALRHGADYLVIGRAVLQQPDPVQAIQLITRELLSA